MPTTVLAFGEILWDLLPTDRKLGGAPFNFAYRLNCLGDEGLIVSRLGRDELGREAFAKVKALGMNTSLLQWDERFATGTVKVHFDEDNHPDYFIVPDVAYDHIEPTDELLGAGGRARSLCFGTLSQRAPTARKTLQILLEACTQALKLLDINLRKNCFTDQTIRSSLIQADVLRCNDDEIIRLGEILNLSNRDIPGVCQEIIERFSISCSLVTLGPTGAYAASANGQKTYVPGYRVDVVDTLGCGDAFTAGFLHRFLSGHPLSDSLQLGNAMGALVATHKGGTEPLGWTDVEAFMQSDPPRVHEESLVQFAPEQGT